MPNVSFDVATKYDNGQVPSVGVNGDGVVVEVHKSQNRDDLYTNFGRIDVGSIAFQGSSRQYGQGRNPHVAISRQGHIVVEVHETGTDDLAYFVGQVDKNAVAFRDAHVYGKGRRPGVAINSSGVAVGFEEDPSTAPRLVRYRVGSVDWPNGTLTNWSSALVNFPDNGITPAVAINDSGVVVVAYGGRSSGEEFLLVMTVVGRIDGSSITFGAPRQLGFGTHPSIALANDNTVVLSYLANAFVTVTYGTGTVDLATQSIRFASVFTVGHQIEGGFDTSKPASHTSVATNGATVIQAFGNTSNQLGYSASVFADRANWMRDNLPLWGSKRLHELSFPGSHDASMYLTRKCSGFGKRCNSQTQIGSYLVQLQDGCRYFDVRPVLDDGVLETGHFGKEPTPPGFAAYQGCDGPPLAEVLADVKRFMDSGAREVVILKFSHYLDRKADKLEFTDATLQTLIAQVVAELKDYLYIQDGTRQDNRNNNRLAYTPLATLLATRGVVLPVFDGVRDELLPPGTYRFLEYNGTNRALPVPDLFVYDQFSDDFSTGTVVPDQLAKLKNDTNHTGDLFLLSWTLTQGFRRAVACSDNRALANDILSLSNDINSILAQELTKAYRGEDQQLTATRIPNVIYIDRVLGFVTDVALWINQRLNLGDTLDGARRDFLGAGDTLYSPTKTFRLTYQADGNLVLYRVSDGANMWSSNTVGPVWRCIMQEDGNFVVYSTPYEPVFDSSTYGHPNARLTINDQGQLSILDANGTRVPAPKLGP